MMVNYIILLLFSLFYQVTLLSTTKQDTVHGNSEYAKVTELENGNILVLSTLVNEQKSTLSIYDKDGRYIYGNQILENGYSASAEIVSKYIDEKSQEYFLFFHNKQNIPGRESKEYVLSIGAEGKNIIYKKLDSIKNSIYKQTSVVPLKNGKILLAGINPVSSKFAQTTLEINIYDPQAKELGNGLTLNAHSKYISCYEQKENDVFCVYVAYDDVYLSKLKIQKFKVTDYGINSVECQEQIIKTFYTEFNFLKAKRFSDTEALILFQTGNGNIKEVEFGNTGKDLYYYHLQTIPNNNEKCSGGKLVKVLRYEYLFNECIYKDDSEYYNADIYPLSKNKIFAVCEYQENKFKGFIIYPSKKTVDRFNFNNFEANSVKNPVFVKFDNTLALFNTHITVNGNSKVVYQMINYPYCEDVPEILLPLYFSNNNTILTRIYLVNPYPASRANENVFFKIVKSDNIQIYDRQTNEELLFNKDYDKETSLKIKSLASKKYNVEYTAAIQDPLDGLVLGRTCKIPIYTPKCLDQCHSCNQTGTEAHHFCLGCKDEHYYEKEDPQAVKDWYGKPHFCYNCDRACSTCFGEFLKSPIKTTNCKVCNYEENYFPFEDESRTCISNETREDWEEYFERAIYLDKSGGEDPKTWIWRKCHKICKKCEEKGDDKDNKCLFCIDDYYFFCNQTLGHGIPGSCHYGCVNNGFYVTEKENRKKCCPCLKNCKVCTNSTKCIHCYPEHFLTDDATKCDDSCGYCLAEDREKWECVNCKTSYPEERFTLNKTCVLEKPYFSYEQGANYTSPFKKQYHVIDEKCNLLEACKEGCHRCSEWFTDKCTECEDGYYKEDPFGITSPKKYFRCFNKTTCQGITPYAHDVSLEIGGVPFVENNEKICLNCKHRNNSYRLPEDRFYCSDIKINRTFVDIEDYNKLTYCYFRCKTCNDWGNYLFMNCTSCRDGANYNLVKYNIKEGLGNCYRKPHKCGIYPYYHDYDLAGVLGKDEDNCGEDCDVCLYNFSCTQNFPYFQFETHECVEYCPMTQLFGQKCALNHSAGFINFMIDPLGLRHPYDYLSKTVNINQVISSYIFKYFASSYNIDVNKFSSEINNYLGHGQIYNLPKSEIIIGNNISIELTSFKLELEKLEEIIKGKTEPTTSVVDLSSCEALLKKKYGLSDEEDLWIIKGDILNKLAKDIFGKLVEYQIFSTSLGAFLPLKDCQSSNTPVLVSNPFISLLSSEFQFKNKFDSVFENEYDPLDIEGPFYNDICSPFTNENGNDVLLDSRRTDYYKDINLCENNCQYIGYNASTRMYSCLCGIKATPGDNSSEYIGSEIVKKEIPEDFKELISRRSNIKVFKCLSQVFSSKGQKNNYGSYILLACMANFIGAIILYLIKERQKMNDILYELSSIGHHHPNLPKPGKPSEKSQKEHHHHSSYKNESKEVKIQNEQYIKSNVINNPKSTQEVFSKTKVNPNDIQKDLILTDDQLNFAPYNYAIKKDNRNYIQYYWSLLKMKQLFIFTFYTSKDYILRSTKISLFTLFIAFYFAFTALFFNDNIMRQIYIYKGNTNAAVHVPNIILSSICCLIMNLIVRFICLNERDINKIINEKNPDQRKSLVEILKRNSKIKLVILYIVAGLLISLCWYYVSAFCAVFKNSQGHYLINVLFAFIVCNIWPCITSFIPVFLRKKALDNGTSETLYKISQIISIF